MSYFFNKNNKVDHSFLNNFRALPFNPPNLYNHRMDIFMAASIGDYALVEEYILNNNESVNFQNRNGWTQAGNIEVCKLLLDNGANPELTNNDGQSANDLAVYWGHPPLN